MIAKHGGKWTELKREIVKIIKQFVHHETLKKNGGILFNIQDYYSVY